LEIGLGLDDRGLGLGFVLVDLDLLISGRLGLENRGQRTWLVMDLLQVWLQLTV